LNKKRHDTTRGKHRTRSKTQPDWTRQIFLAARLAGKPFAQKDSWSLSVDELRLVDLVTRALDTGTDKHVLRAMEDLEEAHLYDAAEKVAFWSESAATNMPVVTKIGDGEDETGDLELFLVPILMMMDAGHEPPICLPDDAPAGGKGINEATPSPLTLLVTSLRRHGLVGKTPSVMALPWLYAYSDLPDTWSGQRGMLRQILHGFVGQPARIPTPKKQPSVKQPTLALRFVVFAIFSAFDDEDMGPLLDGDITDMNHESDQRLDAWQTEVSQIVADAHPGVLFAETGIPAGWSDATHAGIAMHNLYGLANVVVPPVSPTTQVTMGIYLADGGAELRIGVTRNGKFSGGFVWVCHQDPKEEIEDALLALEQMGVPSEQIHVASEVFVEERCPDCGEPYFPSVTTEGLHEHSDEERIDAGERGHGWLH
jgi:hypothetical protein